MLTDVNSKARLRIVVILIIIASLYGSTYQQFRHFDIDQPKGASDAHSYIAMSHGDYNVKPIHRYRIIIPYMSGIILNGLNRVMHNESEAEKLSFYIVNFVVTCLTSFLLFLLFHHFDFRTEISLLGVLFFICSRITILSTATPLVDTLYYLSIVVLVYLIEKRRVTLLCIVLPVMMLSKETFMPFLFLPLVVSDFRKPVYYLSILISLLSFFGIREILLGALESGNNQSLIEIVFQHAKSVIANIGKSFTLSGIHDWQNGFSFLLALSVLGYLKTETKIQIPKYILLFIPIAIGFGLLSGNFGRMLFTAFIPIYCYALVFIQNSFVPISDQPAPQLNE